MRTLKEIANATPADYLTYVPADPQRVAIQMIQTARQKFPKVMDETGSMGQNFEPNYSFLFVGPGAVAVVQELLMQEQIAAGIETSRRGIQSGPEGARTYVRWTLPWQHSFPTMTGDPPRPFKYFDIAFINQRLKDLLLPEEWSKTVEEIEKVSKHSQLI
jgi:hypothetical protein